MSILIIGAGDVGQFIAKKLTSEEKDVIIIDSDEDKIRSIEDHVDAQFIIGNGASPAILKEADIANAEMLIAVTDKDEVNLVSCILANLQSKVPIKIARVRDPEFDIEGEYNLNALNIDLIINPEKEAADAILRVLDVPGAVEILDFFNGYLKLVGAWIKKDSPIINIPLRELKKIRDEQHFLVAAIFRGGELIIPRGEDVLKEGDLLYFVSEADKLNFGMELLGHKIDTIKRVMINGGDYIGLYLARQLEKQGVSVKIIEKDPVVCSKLIRKLNKTIVLNESATERHFLEQENIGSMDAFISVTGDDEDNILSTLLAKSLGVPWSVTLSNQLSYVPLMSSIGIDVVVNPRLIATSEILHFVRRGKVLSVAALKEDIEIIEVEALESSDIVGKPLSKIKWPSSTIVLCVEHEGGIIVPSGDTTINPNDKILLLAHYNDVAKLEKMLTVKLEYF